MHPARDRPPASAKIINRTDVEIVSAFHVGPKHLGAFQMSWKYSASLIERGSLERRNKFHALGSSDEGQGAVTRPPAFPNRTCGFPAYGSPSSPPFQAKAVGSVPKGATAQKLEVLRRRHDAETSPGVAAILSLISASSGERASPGFRSAVSCWRAHYGDAVLGRSVFRRFGG